MPAVWFALKRSLQCKLEASDVHDPKANGNPSNILTRKTSTSSRSGCSRSFANLKEVIHGSKRHTMEKPQTCSSRSIGSSEFLNPVTSHQVVLSNSTCELKITGFGAVQGGNNGSGGSTFVGTLKSGTPGLGGRPVVPPRATSIPLRKAPSSSLSRRGGSGFGGNSSNPKPLFGTDYHSSSPLTCHICGQQFAKEEAVEAHHLSKHAVTELVEGDSSRKTVEIICGSSLLKSGNNYGHIERILKVHNMQKTAQFEEHRETVKIKASKLPNEHPRCVADGNELLRFYGTSVECSLGSNGSYSLCASDNCCLCQILRHGFSIKKELNNGGIGVFTTSTSGRALESIKLHDDDDDDDDDSPSIRKALIVCRVIAGRVDTSVENFQELAGQTQFDSIAGKVGLYSNIEELYLLNPKAVLPCIVVICKP